MVSDDSSFRHSQPSYRSCVLSTSQKVLYLPELLTTISGSLTDTHTVKTAMPPDEGEAGTHLRSRLLKLLAELRNRIYQQALVVHHDIAIGQQLYGRLQLVEEPSLLITCRQVRHEALPIFYADNTFICYDRSILGMCVRCCQAKKLKMIRALKDDTIAALWYDELSPEKLRRILAPYGMDEHAINPAAVLYPVRVGEFGRNHEMVWAREDELVGFEAVTRPDGMIIVMRKD